MRTTAQLRDLLKKALSKPRGRKPKLWIEIDGEYRTMREWVDFMDLDYSKFYYYYNKGIRGRALIDHARKD